MRSKTLHIFNPEHDLALAVGEGPYTPPAEVLKLRKKLSLLPALFANNGDFILIRDNIPTIDISSLPFFEDAVKKNLHLVSWQDIPSINSGVNKILPWGWDHAVISYLLKIGISQDLLPCIDQIDNIRKLSHRRITIPFQKTVYDLIGEDSKMMPKELFSVQEVEEFLIENPKTFFKAPWSSSGRGIVVSDHISRKGLLEWCHGVIKHQGSLIAEKAWKKVFDFATEWIIEKHEPQFLGFSIFETSSRGKYHGNITGDQKYLKDIIKQKAKKFNDKIIEAQYIALKSIIAPHYSGFMGIDMLSDEQGRINPCVEINLRLTMGHVELLKSLNELKTL